MLACQLAIRFLDILLARVLVHAQNLVVILVVNGHESNLPEKGAQRQAFPVCSERSQSIQERSTLVLSEDRPVPYFAVPPLVRPKYRSQESARTQRFLRCVIPQKVAPTRVTASCS